MKQLIFLFAVAALLSCGSFQNAAAQDNDAWGHLSGQIVVKGEAPENSQLDLGDNPDKALCMVDGKAPMDNEILVDENGGLKDVFIMMYVGRGDDAPAIHPSYAETKEEAVTIDNKNCRFEPHALFVRPGQKMILKNSDPTGHNCHITTFNNEHNINIPKNSSVDLVLENDDSTPGKVVCDVHKWMNAVIAVRDNPYAAISDAEGKFKIENIPAGTYKFQLYHGSVGWLKKLEVEGKKPGRKGEFEVTIEKDGTNDLGEMSLPADAFKK